MEKEVEFLIGLNLEEIVKYLIKAKEKNRSICCEFNGHLLYSDNISMDLAFNEVYGMTKKEYDKQKNVLLDDYYDTKRNNSDKYLEFLERGEKLIYKQNYKLWEDYVQTSLNGCYSGMDIENVLEIMEVLNEFDDVNIAKKILLNQDHSGMSELIIRNFVLIFSKRGPEFYRATIAGDISLRDKNLLLKQEQLNNSYIFNESNESKRIYFK